MIECQDKLSAEAICRSYDVHTGRSQDELSLLSRGIHDAVLAEYGIPGRDYFHIVTEHALGQIVAQDAGLGFERTRDVIMIQIFTQGGRSQRAKQSLFAAVAEKLGALGFGCAQYVTGELAVPKK